MEFTAPRWCRALKALSAKRDLTISFCFPKNPEYYTRKRRVIGFYLTIVESSLHGYVVDISVCDRRHLGFLDRGNASLWMEDKYGDVFLIS